MTTPEQACASPVPEHLLLQWHITERCNLRCSHCYQESPAARELDGGEWLAVLEQFRELLERRPAAPRSRGPRGHITVTGGEPFVHPDCLHLLETIAAERRRWSFAVLTNGIRLDAALARHLRRLGAGFVQVSIEGGEATHERIRGEGSYAQAVRGLRHLVAAGVPALISFTAHPGNYREFPAVAELGRRLGVQRVWADRLVPLGAAADHAVLSPAQTRELVELMARERRRGRFPGRRTEIALHRALQFAAVGGVPYRCAAGDTLLTVLANGDVCPCRRLPIVVGNVLDTRLATLYATSPVLQALRQPPRAPVGCESCFYSKTCAGGLRCLAAAVTGNPFRADPGCWLATPREDHEVARLAAGCGCA